MTQRQGKKTRMRCLGEFVGHLAAGIKAQPDAHKNQPKTTVLLEQHTQHATAQTPHGVVTIRRTTIEEADLPAHNANHNGKTKREQR